MRCPTPDDCNEDGVCHGLCGDARTRTDLKALDAHIITPEEYEDIPEWTDAQIAAADLHEGGRLIRKRVRT